MIDSVGVKFLINGPVVTNRNRDLSDKLNVENYLYEVGLVCYEPSGKVYQNVHRKTITNLVPMNIGIILLKSYIASIWEEMKELN